MSGNVSDIKTDICVIGAGSGGLSVAAGAAQMGAKVVLIEAGEMGGDCLNTGCVPSKALLSAAARGMGWDEAHAHLSATIAAIAPHDSVERFEGLGVTVLKGRATFTSPRRVEVAGATGRRGIRARRFVVATGARPAIPDIPGLADIPYLTNETVFALKAAPEHLIILGAGPMGLEMAEAHRRLGCAVTVVEPAMPLMREDPEAAAVVLQALTALGIDFLTGAAPVRIRKDPAGLEITLSDGRSLTGSHLLLATGRAAATEGLGLEAAGIETYAGGISTTSRQRTTNRRVFAIGDVTGGPQFTHAAGYQAGVIIRSMLFGLPARASAVMPRVVYTTPELAQAGLTEAEARAAYGDRLEVIRTDFGQNDRARAGGDITGFLKLMVHRGRPVGATITGTDAGEQIALWSLAIGQRLKLSAIAGTVLPYPTRAEISRRAAGTYFSPRLFDNPNVKRFVRLVQKLLP